MIRRAFTLVEMIIATTLLSIAIVAAVTCVSTATAASAKAEQLQLAGVLLNRLASETKRGLAAGDTQGDFGEGYANYRWTKHLESEGVDGLFKCTWTILWGDPPAELRSLSTYVREEQSAGAQTGNNR